ncbi:MAG TPA: hypothetical protein VMT37_12500 [Solirubrobacterales bacterium]|nr:hypothetical protein [Solirubrobacterales bacterium]
MATTVVNGNFESGGLAGWHVSRQNGLGDWFAYSGTEAPIGKTRTQGARAAPVQPPPEGTHAAISDELNSDSLILYQDIAIDPGAAQQLNLLAYYNSYAPIAIPTPDTLSAEYEQLGDEHNQQFRIDLIKPSAPLDSLAPEDILQTVFATREGATETMKPTWITADLTPLEGQTVRLRIVTVAHEETFNAGVDAVSVTSGSGSNPGISGRFRVGRTQAVAERGIVLVSVRVPGPGRLRATGGSEVAAAEREVAAAGKVTLRLRPSARGRRLLSRKHRFKTTVRFTYTPAGGSPQHATHSVGFRLTGPRP